MEQAQRRFEDGQQVAPVRSVSPLPSRDTQLLELDVPVAELVPEELPDQVCAAS